MYTICDIYKSNKKILNVCYTQYYYALAKLGNENLNTEQHSCNMAQARLPPHSIIITIYLSFGSLELVVVSVECCKDL